jgi:hypothetical protein
MPKRPHGCQPRAAQRRPRRLRLLGSSRDGAPVPASRAPPAPSGAPHRGGRKPPWGRAAGRARSPPTPCAPVARYTGQMVERPGGIDPTVVVGLRFLDGGGERFLPSAPTSHQHQLKREERPVRAALRSPPSPSPASPEGKARLLFPRTGGMKHVPRLPTRTGAPAIPLDHRDPGPDAWGRGKRLDPCQRPYS